MRPSDLPAVVLTLALAASSASAAAVGRRAHKIEATVRNGTYSGLSLPTFEQEAFFAVPFAQPPVGDLRLRQSVALNTSWTGVKPLTERAAQASSGLLHPLFNEVMLTHKQLQCYGNRPAANLTYSEDCLYLNVIRPAGVSAGDDLPVALWIYGGA